LRIRVLKLVQGLGLGTKLAITLGLLILAVAFITGLLVIRQEEDTLKRELKNRGIAIVEDLSRLSGERVSRADLQGLHKLVREAFKTYEGQLPWASQLVYIIIVNDKGESLVHSNPKGSQIDFPLNIKGVDREASRAEGLLIQPIRYEGRPVMDIAFPVYFNRQRVGVARVGLSEEGLEGVLKEIRHRIIIITIALAFFGVVLGFVIAYRMVSPLRRLTTIAREIKDGNLDIDIRMDRWERDEITELAESFNEMTVRLRDKIKEIEATKVYLENLLENANDFIYIMDMNKRFTYVNKKFEELGYRRDDLIGKDFSFFLPNGENPLVYLSGKSPGDRRQVFEVKVKGMKGGFRTLLLSITPLKGSSGRVTESLGIGSDITELKRLEEKALKAERLAVVGEFAAGLAHEIRNPLSSIVTAIRLLCKNDGCNGIDCNALMEVIDKESQRLNRTLTEFLRFARPGQIRLEAHNINTILEETIRAITCDKGMVGKVSIERYLNPGIGEIPIDSDLIRQVFWNILLNGIQATPEGVITVTSGLDNGWVQVRIKDNGHGIAEDELYKIFEPFYTRRREGTGLGLSIANRIVEMHKGVIEVESELGVGTTFTIRLPAGQDNK